MIDASPTAQIPARLLIDRYQLLERVGVGGIGVVWRGFDLDLEEPVAIKLLREEFADNPELRASFRREVKLARRVTHPNVARVFEFGHDDGQYFLTMEYIEGETLMARLRRDGRIEHDQALVVAIGLSRALAAAHAASVVHGDIKGSNILLTPGRGAVLTDFGIARVLSDLPRSAGAEISGTPSYMAPELFDGAATTAQSDLYAVGVVLFETLTGRSLWPALGEVEMRERKRREPPIERLAPGLPRGWVDLIQECLRVDPDRRPRDAKAILSRLAQLHDGPMPLTPRPLPPPLASGDGPQWVQVTPLQAEDGGGVEWVTADIVGALTQIRGVRVMTAEASPDGVQPLHRVELRGEVREVDDGVVASVALVDSETQAPRAVFQIHKPRSELHNLGVEVAAGIVTAVDPTRRPPELAQEEALDQATAELYQRARSAFLAMRPQDALPLYEEALQRMPRNVMLRLGHALSLSKSVLVQRQPSAAQLADLRRRAEALLGEFGELGEPHLLMAEVLLAQNEPVAAAAYLASALARAPSLTSALTLVAMFLIEVGRLPDAERRLDIVSALDARSVQGISLRTHVFAYQGRWSEYYGLLEGKLTQARYRTVACLRPMLWRPDASVLARIEPAIARNDDNLPEPLWRDAYDLVAFLRERRPEIRDRLAARHPRAGSNRHGRLLAQTLCEMSCMLGELERARDDLAFADRCELTEWSWIERCPSIDPLRDEPVFKDIQARVRARADRVAEALWG